MKYTVQSLQPRIDHFLQPLLAQAGFALTYRLISVENPHPEVENPEVTVQFQGEDVDLLLENRAELLLSLEHLSMEALRMPPEDHSLISFDANDYRLLRMEELRMSAQAAADKVKRTRTPFHFNPMTSRERRVIHLALREEKDLRSESIGVGPARAVVVVPADMPTPPLRPCRTGHMADIAHARDSVDAAIVGSGADFAVAARIALAMKGTVRPVTGPLASSPLMNPSDTIVAVVTPLARGGLGVVRLSGPESVSIASRILHSEQDWRPWHVHRANLLDTQGGTIDQVLVTYFAAPRSYTADDVIEISCHGAPVVLQLAVERALATGARLAEPGEFTFRAYLNGRIDLPRAEAIRDLIDATTLYQARVAAQQLDGSVSRRLQPAKEQLLSFISLLEAGIDFAEDDVSVAESSDIADRLQSISAQLSALEATFQAGRLVFGGFTLAITGRPNVGKSSLFNRLLQQDRAIVTEIPGTTRDTVSESTSFAGIPVKLIDTAGIRKSSDLVESLGIERSMQAAADADLTLFVFDASRPWLDEDESIYARLQAAGPLLVANKSDLVPQISELQGPQSALRVSAVTGAGIPELKTALLQKLAPDGLVRPEEGAITNIRHASLLRESIAALANAVRAVEFGLPHELILIDLYAALRPVDAITGATTADDILNRIFSTFCIGK